MWQQSQSRWQDQGSLIHNQGTVKPKQCMESRTKHENGTIIDAYKQQVTFMEVNGLKGDAKWHWYTTLKRVKVEGFSRQKAEVL